MCQWNPTLAQRSRKDGAPRRLEHWRHLRYTSASNLNREMTVVTLRQPAFDSSPITVRKARAEDAPVCGRICYEAFTRISTEHGFPPDFPSVEVATGVLSMMFSHPGFYCVVAESGGQILGSNCLDERSAIAGVGPITLDPEVQNKGVGRALMEAVLARSAQRGFQGARLLQAAFHNRSLSLYTKLGFDTREPISTMQGPSRPRVRDTACVPRACRIWRNATGFVEGCMVTTAAASCAMQSSKEPQSSLSATGGS